MKTSFRVWDEKYHNWDSGKISFYPGEDILKQGRVIQFWTGLYDKNKVKIYEGDIVKIDEEHMSVRLSLEIPRYTHAEVFCHKGSFRVGQVNFGSVDVADFALCD